MDNKRNLALYKKCSFMPRDSGGRDTFWENIAFLSAHKVREEKRIKSQILVKFHINK